MDEFTGRLMIGRRYSDGLHQAIEAKEGVKIRNENKTYATITFQNFFRLYKKLSGMTGYRKDGGRGIPYHLLSGRSGDPHQQARHPQGYA